MSDYGFATYDEKTGKKRLGSINSKWPIFGPKYSDISKCYKTFHIVDTYVPEYWNAPLPTPTIVDNYGTSEDRKVEKQLVHRFEHGLGYRPVGYAFISGNIRLGVKCSLSQVTGGTYPSDYGGTFSTDGMAVQVIPVLPSVKNQMVASYIETGYSPSELSLDNYFFGVKNISGMGLGTREDMIISDDCMGLLLKDYTVANRWTLGEEPVPYVVEIDDKYVSIYRNIYWLDYWFKYYRVSSYSTVDINTRIKGVTTYAGTSLDCTIYLAPYRMEDLI